MRSLVLYTLATDKSKILANIKKHASPGTDYFTHQVKLIGSQSQKGRKLHEEIRAWVTSMSEGHTIETIIWLGHAAAGRLSGQDAEGGGAGTVINLDQVAELITIAKPRVVNFFACNFGKVCTANHPPYAVTDGPLYVAKRIAATSSWTGHVMVLNSDKNTAVFVSSVNNFQEVIMDRNIMIADRAVAEVKYFEVGKIMKYAREHTEGEYMLSGMT